MTSRLRRRLPAGVAVLGTALVIGAIAVMAMTPQPDPDEVCDGVQRGLGGCDPDQPTFVGETCQEVGTEFGKQLEGRIVAILRGSDVVDGQGKSARISASEFLLTTRANQHLRRIGIVAECGVEEFAAAAEAEFSDELQADIGPVLSEFQNHDYTYDEWLKDLRKTLRAIDMEEEAG